MTTRLSHTIALFDSQQSGAGRDSSFKMAAWKNYSSLLCYQVVLTRCLYRRWLQGSTSFVEAMHQLMTSLHTQGDVKTSMPKPVELGDIKTLVESQSGDAASSLRDVNDLYPCMLTMCGSGGTCIAVRGAVAISCQLLLTPKFSRAIFSIRCGMKS